MKPWFNWKGIYSYDMGVIVESLPDITRPAKRVDKIEIDGRNGDILVDQGYETYNKVMSLGITHTDEEYLDNLLNWLTGSGQWIASTEPNRYYHCAMIDGIDLERLCSFRTAKIKLYTQPFKYLVGETPVVKDAQQTSMAVYNQGNIASLPIMKVSGKGTVDISVNGKHAFQLALGDGDEITIDSGEQEAYGESIVVLKNRQMKGVFPQLQPGINPITWTGTVTELQVWPESRWI